MSVQSPHFWSLSSDKYVGGIKIEVSFNCDPRYVTMSVRSMLAQVIRFFLIKIDNLKFKKIDFLDWNRRRLHSNRLSVSN